MDDCILVRYGEIALKSDQTRKWWNKTLLENMKDCLEKNNISYSSIDVQLEDLLYIRKRKKEASVALKNVFGITSLSPAIRMETDFEKIKYKCLEISNNKGKKFRVSARRITKEFPMTSDEVNGALGAFLKEKLDLEVNLTNFDFEMGHRVS